MVLIFNMIENNKCNIFVIAKRSLNLLFVTFFSLLDLSCKLNRNLTLKFISIGDVKTYYKNFTLKLLVYSKIPVSGKRRHIV